MGDGELDLEVGAANPQLGHDPVLGQVARCPDRIVGSRSLLELNGDRNEISARVADYEEDEWSDQVSLVGVTMDCRNVRENAIVCYVQMIVL